MDDLMVAARAVTTAESHPWLHRVWARGHLEYFTVNAPERLIADAVELADKSWAIVELVVRRHAAGGDQLVMDWWLFEPERVAELDPPVGAVWLHINPESLEARERANDGWRRGSTDPEAMHRNFMTRSLWRNEYVAGRAEGLGQPVLRLDGTEAVEEVVERALELLG